MAWTGAKRPHARVGSGKERQINRQEGDTPWPGDGQCCQPGTWSAGGINYIHLVRGEGGRLGQTD